MELKISEKNSLDCKDEDNSINKHIHQIWIGEKPVPYIYINSWKDDYISKNKDWQYTLWNEKEINSLFLNNIEDDLIKSMYNLYKLETLPEGKADIARIVILYYCGGVYIDADSVWLNNKSLDPLIEKSANKGFFAAFEKENCSIIANGVFGSTPKHTNLLKMMNILKCLEDGYLQLRIKYDPWQITGPVLITKLDCSTLTLFPSIYFYPIYWHGISDNNLHKKIELPKESYMFQYGISTNELDYSQENPNEDEDKCILFSCTTYLNNINKYNILRRALDKFVEYNKKDFHLIGKFLILMEYSDLNILYINELVTIYPDMTFIPKTEDQKGQAKSLNMIIDSLKDYKYWLHWEDSWYCTTPILKKAYNTISKSEVNFLQLVKNDIPYNMPIVNNDHIECYNKDDFKIIKPHNYLKKLWRFWEINDFDWSIWKDSGWYPLYSLRPCIQEVNLVLKTGYFTTDASKWPFQFEFEWALKWIRRNNIVFGIWHDITVVRDEKHISTYTMDDYNKWLKKLENKEHKEKYNRQVPYYTFKSDKQKLVIFWQPGYCGTILKKFIYCIEEGFEYSGSNINTELDNNNNNKYFLEINDETLKRFASYKKVSVLEKDNIYINPEWIDEKVDIKDITIFLKKYGYGA